MTFALEEPADHRACEIEVLEEGGTCFTWAARGEEVKVRLPLLGTYNVENFLAAAACASELGVSRIAVVEAVREAVAEKWRGQIHRSRGATIVDDSYNSNPAALKAALKSARELPGRRYWAILGAMLELGASSARFHDELGARAVSEGFSTVLGVGEEARALVESVRKNGGEGEWFASAADVAPAAAARLEPGDVVLVKGSRGIGLEVTVEYLLGESD